MKTSLEICKHLMLNGKRVHFGIILVISNELTGAFFFLSQHNENSLMQ